jgi:CRISPR-associated protein Csd1
MLLERLREYALDQDDAPPAGYQHQPVRYIIRIDESGRFLRMLDTADTGNGNRGRPTLAPHVKRSSGVKAKLLADNGEYVLGIAREDPKKPANLDRIAAQHEAFVNLVKSCAEATGEPSVRAVVSFLQGDIPAREQLDNDFDPAATITFRVSESNHPEGVLPVEQPSVQAFWADYVAPDSDAAGSDTMACIVCGTVGPVLERHPLKIKGIPGGQTSGMDLISANAPAFESYGLKASQIAPTCPTCAEAYGNGLNALLADKTTSLWTKELAYAFWTDKADDSAGEIVVGLFAEPEAHPGEVRELLTSFWAGKTASLAIDPTRFYAAAFGASGARVVVKDWIDTTVGEARARLARYFALQHLVEWDGSGSTPVRISYLANATVHRKATAPPIVSKSLVRLALAGDPLPLDVLFLAVRRNRAEQRVTRNRAMLIKMVLASRSSQSEEEVIRMSDLNSANTQPAYVCGRLLATLDRIQRTALGKPNATIVDKFYGTASSAPAAVFGTLLHGAQNHLGKLRGPRTSTFNALDRELQDILALLTSFPRTLTLEEQGLFALGFYHQRADDRAQAIANKAKREAAGQQVSEEDETLGDVAEA